MINITIFLLATFGISSIITKEYIFAQFRKLFSKVEFIHKLINCTACFSFWVALGLSFLIPNLLPITNIILYHFICGVIGYAFTKIISTWVNNNNISING